MPNYFEFKPLTPDETKPWTRRAGTPQHAGQQHAGQRYAEQLKHDGTLKQICADNRKVFSGKLFREEKDGWQRVVYAIEIDSTDLDCQTLIDRGRRVFNVLNYAVIQCIDNYIEDQYHVFVYQIPKGCISFREMIEQRQAGAGNAKNFLLRLLRLLQRYQEAGAGDYIPLGLCPDTIYLSERGDLYILPIYNGAVEACVPPEIRIEPSPDVSSDVYSACLMAHELAHETLLEDGTIFQRPDDALICQALLPCAQWRPSIGELINELSDGNEETEPALGGTNSNEKRCRPHRAVHAKHRDVDDSDPGDGDNGSNRRSEISGVVKGKCSLIKTYLSNMFSEELDDFSERNTGTKKGGWS